MVDPQSPAADPSAIGGIPEAPYALRPDPTRVFARRAERFAGLAPGHALAPYLAVLASLSRVQADLAATLPPAPPIAPDRVAQARDAAMPPIARDALAAAPDAPPVLDRLFAAAATLDMPPAARAALRDAASVGPAARRAMIDAVLAGAIPADSLAAHLFVAAGVQLLAARTAATLDPARLVPVATGVCPACGGLPVASVVVGVQGADGARYAVCASCATCWNEVRVKCLACGSTKGIGYREVEGGGEAATVKAEVCDECRAWVKILYQNRNPSLEAVADDVGSLGLDLLMRETDYRRAGFNPFLLGY